MKGREKEYEKVRARTAWFHLIVNISDSDSDIDR
jgi:hypothetical protein